MIEFNFFKKVSLIFTNKKILYRHGRTVAKYPWIYIFVVLITTFICSLGIVSFRWENNIVRLWNPKNSETLRNFDWLWKNHPPDLRRHHIIFQAENVLDPAMFKVGEF